MIKKIALGMISLLTLTVIAGRAQMKNVSGQKPAKEYEVAVYYFPDYHPDSINARWHGQGWTEWSLVKDARPRFPGQQQPKQPLWGYFNESDPKGAAR